MFPIDAFIIMFIAGCLLLTAGLIFKNIAFAGWMILFSLLNYIISFVCYIHRDIGINLEAAVMLIFLVEVLLMGFFLVSDIAEEDTDLVSRTKITPNKKKSQRKCHFKHIKNHKNRRWKEVLHLH